MNRTVRVRASALAAFLVCALTAYTYQATPPPTLTIEVVKDDLYMIVGDGGNVAGGAQKLNPASGSLLFEAIFVVQAV